MAPTAPGNPEPTAPSAPPPAPATAPAAGAAAEQAPAIDITKGWQGESYDWPEETSGGDTPPAQPQSQQTPPPQQQQAAPPPGDDDLTPVLDKLATAKLTPEQIAKLEANPELRSHIDRKADSRFGNLKQKEDAERARQNTEAQAWAAADDAWNALQELKRTNPEDYAARVDPERNPDGAQWVANYVKLRTAREAQRASGIDVNAITARTRQQALTEWNQAGAKAFAEHAKASLPFYAKLPSEVRKTLEAGTQTTDAPWINEYLGYIGQHFDDAVKTAVAEERQAWETEQRAAGGSKAPTGAPVMMPAGGAGGRDMSPQEILARHMDFGFDSDRHGVRITEEQLAAAKKALNRDY